MRTLFSILLFMHLVFSFETSFAQKRTAPKSTITFYSTDSNPIHVSINNKVYNQYAQKISIGNVPGHKPHIEIFTVSFNKKGNPILKKIYSGRIVIEQGKENFIEINPLNKKVKQSLAPPSFTKNALTNEDFTHNQAHIILPEHITDPELEKILEEMAQFHSDEEKLAIILKSNQQWSFPNILTLMKQLLFDESRLKFLRNQDLSNFSSQQIELLQETFTSPDARHILERYK